MRKMRNVLTFIVAAATVSLLTVAAAKKPTNLVEFAERTPGLLWQNPADIESRDLYYGPGSREHEPHGTFTFLQEDLDGTHPKIIVRDQHGVRWTAKLGSEAAPETAASRLVWAAGYFASEDYFARDLKVDGLPAHLHRGGKWISPGGMVRNARLKRHLEHEKKAGNWRWRDNPFVETREFNGLRVLMALINNWDLTDENNAVYDGADNRRIYMVSDLGASFGAGRLTWPTGRNMGNLAAYQRSKFITSVSGETVDFHTPGPDSPLFLATPKEYFAKVPLRRIGRHIPTQDARWMGELLGRLSNAQIRDAFRAAGYSDAVVDGFTSVIEARITSLRGL